MSFETQKLKLIVTILSMCVAVDGLLKISSNLTMIYYYGQSKFFPFLVGRIVVGGILTIWSYYGLAVLFYDFITGIVVYSCGILLLTLADFATLVVRLYLSESRWTHIFDTDEFASKGLAENNLRVSKGMLKQGVLEEILTWYFLICQIMVFFFGIFLAVRLGQHRVEQERYNRTLARLHELRVENQAHEKKKKEQVVNVTHLR